MTEGAKKPPLGIRILQAFAGVATIAALVAGGLYGYRTVLSHPITRVVYAGELDASPTPARRPLPRQQPRRCSRTPR